VLSIFLLGPPRVEAAGKPVPIRRRKALALLSYLCATRGAHTREALAALLWPEAEPERAHADLRNILWILSRTAAAECLEIDRDRVSLLPRPDVWIDVAEFRARLERCREEPKRERGIPEDWVLPLGEAAELYRDHFLSGFHLRGSPEFDEWQAGTEEQLRGGLARALGLLVRHCRAHGDWEQAVIHAERWYALDRFNESVLRQLLELHARAGQRGRALNLYRKSARLFREELGHPPEAETSSLGRRISSGEWEAAPEAGGEPPAAHNLPAPVTSFVGRAEELAQIDRILQDPDKRLLTLVGVGGNGKTRLALQAAAGQRQRFRDGVFFTPLAHAGASSSMVASMLESLRVPPASPEAQRRPVSRGEVQQERTHLLGYLRGKRMLLLLDNLEHLLSECGLISELLEAAPEVKVLATSRTRLGLSGERVLEVSGLPCCAESEAPEPGEWCAATRLFLSRAEQAGSPFTPGEEELAAVAAICRAVEGNPLGIELAAGWTGVLSPSEIAREIGRSPDFLSTRRRDVPRRHRSLRAVFEQSWSLLSPEERECYSRLSVFRGGFSRGAAASVAGATLPLLAGLIEKSLLRRKESGLYELREVLRQFAEERLCSDAAELARVRELHSRFHLDLLRGMEARLKGAEQIEALRELARLLEDVHQAFSHAVAGERFEDLCAAVPALFLLYDIRSRFREGAEFFGAAAETLAGREEGPTRRLLGQLTMGQGWFLRYLEPARGRALVQRGHELLERHGSPGELAFAKALAAILDVWPKEEMIAELQRAARLCESVDDRWGLALVLEVLAFSVCGHDPDSAMRHAQKSLRLRRRLGDRWGITLSLYIQGLLAEEQRLFPLARRRYQESLALRRELGEDLDGVAACLSGIGRVSRRLGRCREALRHYQESMELSRRMGNRWRLTHTLTLSGLLAYELGRPEQARDWLEEALPLYEDLGEDSWQAVPRAILANVHLALSNEEEAGALLSQASGEDRGETAAPNPWRWLAEGRLAASGGRAAEAAGHFRRSLREAAALRHDSVLLESIVALAGERVRHGEPVAAVEMLARVLEDPGLAPATREAAQTLRRDCARKMTRAELREAVERGKARTLEDVAR